MRSTQQKCQTVERQGKQIVSTSQGSVASFLTYVLTSLFYGYPQTKKRKQTYVYKYNILYIYIYIIDKSIMALIGAIR